jgi:hypothetical protein
VVVGALLVVVYDHEQQLLMQLKTPDDGRGGPQNMVSETKYKVINM